MIQLLEHTCDMVCLL